MQNEEGRVVDLYLPRKCSATNRLIPAKDHGSVQLNVGQVDESGRYTGEFYIFALAGFIRLRGESDACLDRLPHERGLLTFSKYVRRYARRHRPGRGGGSLRAGTGLVVVAIRR